MTATTKQLDYRADLIRGIVARIRTIPNDYVPGERPMDRPFEEWTLRLSDLRAAREAAFALALPEPQTGAEARAQLDCLAPPFEGAPALGATEYARRNRQWAQPIMTALATVWGKRGESVPATTTVAELRALISA